MSTCSVHPSVLEWSLVDDGGFESGSGVRLSPFFEGISLQFHGLSHFSSAYYYLEIISG